MGVLFELRWVRRFAVMLLSLACSSLLAVVLRPVLHDKAQLLPFTLAVIVASTYAGLAAGLTTTALSFLIADFFFMEPVHELLSTRDDYALLFVFVMFGCSSSILNYRLAKANLAVLERSRELVRSNEELQRFAHSVAHDLQEPLRAVRAFTEMFLNRHRTKLDPESFRLLDFVVDGADRMKRLIEAILDFSTAGKEGEASQIDTGAVVSAAIQDLHTAIDQSSADVCVDPLPSVYANGAQLGRVFLNLIGNAIKYHDSRTPLRIVVSAKSRQQEWMFSVKDNGAGIEPKYHDRIFETFQRMHGGSKRGHGLGLATCKRIVEQHGGRIWVESEPGQGADFRFTLPRKR